MSSKSKNKVKEPGEKKRRDPVKVDFSKIAITDSVPIPENTGRGKYPFDKLSKYEESFLVQCSESDSKRVELNMRNAARRMSKIDKGRFLVKYQPEEEGVRAWRTDEPVLRFDPSGDTQSPESSST